MTRLLVLVPDIDGGGVGSVIYNYISHMNREGFEIELITQDYGYEQFLHQKFIKCGVKINYVIPRREGVKKHFKMVSKIIRNGHFDIIHCNDQNWSFFYLMIALKYGVKKRIAHSHLTMQNHDRAKIMILNMFTPLLKKVATGYFACGIEAGRYMWGDKIADSKQLYVMNNAIDPERFKYCDEIRIQYRNELNLSGKYVIGHIGRFSDQKNHSFLIDIFDEYLKINPNAILLLIGKGELEQEIRNKVKGKQIESKVKFLGLRNDVNNLLNVFDLFLFPSLFEGLPVVGIEAQANGLPCLFSDTITDEVFLLETTKDRSLNDSAARWALCIEEMRKNTIDRYKGIEIVSQKGFDLNVEAEKLRNYYLMKKGK